MEMNCKLIPQDSDERVIDFNERSLREIVIGLGGVRNGIHVKTGSILLRLLR
jgi:formyltetrahydrofolate synthetase